jgi:hypothetical protein
MPAGTTPRKAAIGPRHAASSSTSNAAGDAAGALAQLAQLAKGTVKGAIWRWGTAKKTGHQAPEGSGVLPLVSLGLPSHGGPSSPWGGCLGAGLTEYPLASLRLRLVRLAEPVCEL